MPLLLRHGKAESGLGIPDAERRLAKRGRRDCEAAGRAFAQSGVRLGLAVVSPAVRAQETWEYFQVGYEADVAHTFDRRIYDNTIADLLSVVVETSEDVEAMLLVGHNPALAGLAERWDHGDTFTDGFPTATLATFELAGAWRSADMSHSRLVDVWWPDSD